MTQRAVWAYEGPANLATVPRAVQVGSIGVIFHSLCTPLGVNQQHQGLFLHVRPISTGTRCLPSASIGCFIFHEVTYQDRR